MPKLWHILKTIGIDWRYRRLVSNLYLQQEEIVRVGNGYSKPPYIGRGLRQRCPLSPILFLIYAGMMMIDAMEEIEEGIKVGGKLVNDVRFADDHGMVADSEGGLQKLMDGLNRMAKEYDMKVNIKKTKVMKVSRKGEGVINITIDGEILEQVERFRYLGALITSDVRCKTEIKTRIGMAKNAFNQRKELLSQNLNNS